MHGVFDIVGPIMIGPSSSHTAGACRLGLMSRVILGSQPTDATIELVGSFAATYRGHGTDKAIIAGLLGMSPEDERLPYSFDIARDVGLNFSFVPVRKSGVHPNTAIIRLTDSTGHTIRVEGASIGGGNIMLTELNGFRLELSGALPSIIVAHLDRPGVIANTTRLIAEAGVNIASMRDLREKRGQTALIVIETDEELPPVYVDKISSSRHVLTTFTVPKL